MADQARATPIAEDGSTDSERLISSYYQAIDAGDLDAVYRLFHSSIVYQRGPRTIRGIAALRRFYERERGVTRGRHRLLTMLVDRDWVAVRGTLTATMSDGQDARIVFSDFHHLRDGRIWRRYTYFAGRAI